MSGEPHTTLKKLTENINIISKSTCIVLQWTLAHAGIKNNEIADMLAKEGRGKGAAPITSVQQRRQK